MIGLIAAEQAGAFRQPAKYPAYFACAMRSSDDPVIVNEDGSPSPIQARLEAWPGVNDAAKDIIEEAEDDPEVTPIVALREKATRLGIPFDHALNRYGLAKVIEAHEGK